MFFSKWSKSLGGNAQYERILKENQELKDELKSLKLQVQQLRIENCDLSMYKERAETEKRTRLHAHQGNTSSDDILQRAAWFCMYEYFSGGHDDTNIDVVMFDAEGKILKKTVFWENPKGARNYAEQLKAIPLELKEDCWGTPTADGTYYVHR